MSNPIYGGGHDDGYSHPGVWMVIFDRTKGRFWTDSGRNVPALYSLREARPMVDASNNDTRVFMWDDGTKSLAEELWQTERSEIMVAGTNTGDK
jgi:hypothetical protein